MKLTPETIKFAPADSSEGSGLEAEKYQPELSFNINPDYDKTMCLMFWRNHVTVHPKLAYLLDIKDEALAKAEITKFVDEFYQSHQSEIEQQVQKGQADWAEVETSFFAKVEEMFHSYPWPPSLPENQNHYQAMGSIWNHFPRNIKHQRFSIPANPEFTRLGANNVIAHEMLHFITYDYLEKKYGLQPSEFRDPKNPDNPDYDNTFWQFTENLNALIEDDPVWAEFMDGKKAHIKPECKPLYDKMKVIWDQNKDIDNLVRQIFNLT